MTLLHHCHFFFAVEIAVTCLGGVAFRRLRHSSFVWTGDAWFQERAIPILFGATINHCIVRSEIVKFYLVFDNWVILFDAILPCWYNEKLYVFVLCILEYPLNSGFLRISRRDGLCCFYDLFIYIPCFWSGYSPVMADSWWNISLFRFSGSHRDLGSSEFPLIAQYLSGGVICLNAAVLGFAAWHWQLLILLRFWLSSQMLPWMFSYNKSRLSESSDQVLYMCI